LDTPEGADHLLAFYGHHGFRRVGTVQLEGKSYRSGILSKATTRPERRSRPDLRFPRRPADTAMSTCAADSYGRRGQLRARSGPDGRYSSLPRWIRWSWLWTPLLSGFRSASSRSAH
jgi:hypothetical protein